MRSATERLPRSKILLTTWVTSTEWYTGSGMSSRRGAGPLRGIRRRRLRRPPDAGRSAHWFARCARSLCVPLRAIARAGLLAVADARGVESAADDLVADAGKVADTAAAHEHDRVLLQVVPHARDVRRYFLSTRQTHAGHLTESRV